MSKWAHISLTYRWKNVQPHFADQKLIWLKIIGKKSNVKILALKIELTTGAIILKLTYGHFNMSVWAHILFTFSRKQKKNIMFFDRNQFYPVELENINNKDSWS